MPEICIICDEEINPVDGRKPHPDQKASAHTECIRDATREQLKAAAEKYGTEDNGITTRRLKTKQQALRYRDGMSGEKPPAVDYKGRFSGKGDIGTASVEGGDLEKGAWEPER